jgi:cytochrome P450
MQFTLKVIANMLVSLEPEGEEQEKFRANFKVISSSFASLPLKVPGTAFHRGLKARNRMYAMLDSVIARRRSGREGEAAAPSDFLQTLLRKHAGDEADKLTDAQLKDNILTLLVAGHDTTTAGLTWLVKFLGENPDVLDKLRVSLSVRASAVRQAQAASTSSYTCGCRRSTWRSRRGSTARRVSGGLMSTACLTQTR